MLSPKIEARKSEINGIGLFAKSDITKGEVVWKDDDSVIKFKMSEIQGLQPQLQEFIIKYVGSTLDEKIHLDTDEGIHLNHSCDPNTGLADDKLTEIALRDIKKDEEITINYLDFPVNKELDFDCKCEKHSN